MNADTTTAPLWTITELAERVAAELAGDGRATVGGDGRPSEAEGRRDAGDEPARPPEGRGRGREVPDTRTIRWYQTTGLVDRPVTLRGRTALYGRRHLLQLLAIKRLQSSGWPLATIQAELSGAGERQLAALAEGVTPGATVDGEAASAAGPQPAPRPRFWARDADADRSGTPLESRSGAAQAVAVETSAAAHSPEEVTEEVTEEPVDEAVGVVGVRLGGGVTLLLDGVDRLPSPDERWVLRRAAAPLLAALHQLGVSAPSRPATDHRRSEA